MKERGNRDEMVIATKYTGPSPVPFASAKIRVNFAGNHTKSLVLSVEASLKQMQTSYIDIVRASLARVQERYSIEYMKS